MFCDSDGIYLDHFHHIRGGLEYFGVDESLNDPGIAERRAGGRGICEVLEQTDGTMLYFDISPWA